MGFALVEKFEVVIWEHTPSGGAPTVVKTVKDLPTLVQAQIVATTTTYGDDNKWKSAEIMRNGETLQGWRWGRKLF